jgi:hypothetical protein
MKGAHLEIGTTHDAPEIIKPEIRLQAQSGSAVIAALIGRGEPGINKS